MPLAHEVANELRKLADALDKEPDTQLTKPMVSFYNDTKDQFLATARLFPRPLKKDVSGERYLLENDSSSTVWWRSVADRKLVCAVIEPAKPAVYDCPPLLTELEEHDLQAQ
jgi:hypothetical protein